MSLYKPDSLRAHLRTALSTLATNPDSFLIWVEDGSAVCTNAQSLSFEYRYTLKVLLKDWPHSPDVVMVPLLAWLKIHQNELMANTDNREKISFETEAIDNKTSDIGITLPLTERVVVTVKDGRYQMEHAAEPQPEEPYEAEHWQLYVRDELMAEWDNPK